MVNYGIALLHGQGVEKNEKEAVSLFKAVIKDAPIDSIPADADDISKAAYTCLAYCLLNGLGVATNEQQALQILRQLAAKGDSDALNVLCYCYRYGVDVAKDEKEALKCLQQAVQLGNATGMRECV